MKHELETLEPQCDVQSSDGVLVRVHMLQVCVHVKHVVVLVFLRNRVIISVIVNVPIYIFFTCM